MHGVVDRKTLLLLEMKNEQEKKNAGNGSIQAGVDLSGQKGDSNEIWLGCLSPKLSLKDPEMR